MKHLFLPYGLALTAKEKGFDEPCIYHFKKAEDSDNHSNHATFELAAGVTPFGRNHNELPTRVSAPLYQQIIDWFREKHNIHIEVYRTGETTEGFNYGCCGDKWEKEGVTDLFNIYTKTYYEAFDNGIEQALKLI